MITKQEESIGYIVEMEKKGGPGSGVRGHVTPKQLGEHVAGAKRLSVLAKDTADEAIRQAGVMKNPVRANSLANTVKDYANNAFKLKMIVDNEPTATTAQRNAVHTHA